MKGILFKEEMFRAVVEGRKTQTRRVVKIHLDGIDENGMNDWYNKLPYVEWQPEDYGFYYDTLEGETIRVLPKYQPGETVYLKEPFWYDEDEDVVIYKYGFYDGAEWWDNVIIPFHQGVRGRWQNKLFMPAKYARYFIKITNVRVERVQDISEEDVIAEGIDYITTKYWGWHRVEWENLWTEINGKQSWESNPFVFVYEFELTGK